MIKKLHLKNFKAHADTEITFGPVTTFIGRSDEGKSTVGYKALRIALMGQNWNPGALRIGTTKGSIEAELDDGSKILRTRSETGQSVKLTDADGNTQKYTGQKDTLSFVLAMTGLKKVELDSQEGPEDLNFVANGQQPFLIENSPEVIQRKVVGILRCNEIESAKIRLTKRLNQKKDDQKYLAEEHSRLVARLEALVPVREKVHQVDNALDDAIDRHQQTNHKIELLGDLKKCTHLYRYTVEKLRFATTIYELGLKSHQIRRKLQLLRELEEQRARQQVSSQQAFNNYALKLIEARKELQEERIVLRELVAECREQISEIQIGTAEQLLDQGVCPICGSQF